MRRGALPLAKVFQIKAVCEDCGRRTVMGRNQIDRERLRRQVATPEELGSKLICSHCVERGTDGKNITIRVIDAAGVTTALKIDRRPLTAIDRAIASCTHCGFHIVMERQQLDELPDVRDVDHLARAAYCMTCKEAGSPDPSLTLRVEPPMPDGGDSEKPKWSEAEVFGEDRSDPFDSLPRRSVFV